MVVWLEAVVVAEVQERANYFEDGGRWLDVTGLVALVVVCCMVRGR